MAHPKHQQIRQLYRRQCEYCGVAGEDVAGELTIDHFFPLSAGGDEGDGNLVYACHRCNLYKGDFRPDDDDIRFGMLAPATQARLDEFIARSKEGQLSSQEEAELDQLLTRTDQLTLVKTRARYTLRHQQAGATGT